MRTGKKIPGFTLPEIIVVMAIVALVILTGYSVYYIMNIQFENYRRASDDYLQIHEFTSTLSHDIFQCDKLLREEDRLKAEYENLSIEYSFHPEYAIRKTTIQADTFHFKTIDLFSSFKDESIKSGLINAIELELQYAGEIVSYEFHKQYTAAILYGVK